MMSIDKDGNVEYIVNPNRIEALRAASRVVPDTAWRDVAGDPVAVHGKMVIRLAEQFVKWLEER